MSRLLSWGLGGKFLRGIAGPAVVWRGLAWDGCSGRRRVVRMRRGEVCVHAWCPCVLMCVCWVGGGAYVRVRGRWCGVLSLYHIPPSELSMVLLRVDEDEAQLWHA